MREQCFLTAAVQNIKRLVASLRRAFLYLIPCIYTQIQGFVNGLTLENIEFSRAFSLPKCPFDHNSVPLHSCKQHEAFLYLLRSFHDSLLHPGRCFVLHGVKDMRIGVKRKCDRVMAQRFRKRLGGNAARDGFAGERVPQVVETDVYKRQSTIRNGARRSNISQRRTPDETSTESAMQAAT